MSTYIDKEDVRRAMDGRWEEAYALYTPLKQKGEHLCGPCPLHKGKGPNFKVEAATGFWFCHSKCGRGGDFFAFIMWMHGLPLVDALELIARWAGMTVPPRPPRPAEKHYRPTFEAPTEKTPPRRPPDGCARSTPPTPTRR